MNPDHSTVIPYIYGWIWMKNMYPDYSTQRFRMFSSWIEGKKGNPGHSTQWFRIFSAWFEWETRILIAPHRDSVQIRLNEWKRRILITLLRIWMQNTNLDHSHHTGIPQFQLNLNVKRAIWSLNSVVPHILWMSMPSVAADWCRCLYGVAASSIMATM